jgi:hypothetical protein
MLMDGSEILLLGDLGACEGSMVKVGGGLDHLVVSPLSEKAT